MDHLSFDPLLRQVCAELVAQPAQNLTSESVVLVDPAQQHYQVVELGWDGVKRYYNVRVHLRVVADKVSIERDTSEPGVANRLLAAGLTHEQIVLAFYSPQKRALTDFAHA